MCSHYIHEASERSHWQVRDLAGIRSCLQCCRNHPAAVRKGHRRIPPYNLNARGLSHLGGFLGELPLLNETLSAQLLLLFYLSAHFHRSELFSIHLRRQPDYHPLRSAHNNNSLSGVIAVDHASRE